MEDNLESSMGSHANLMQRIGQLDARGRSDSIGTEMKMTPVAAVPKPKFQKFEAFREESDSFKYFSKEERK
jgi:hypothetical protein